MSTSSVSPSSTETTFAVQTVQVGPAWPATHLPRRASAAAGTASRKRSAMSSARRTIKFNPRGRAEVADENPRPRR
jgi:hypothetical protein